MAVTPNSAITPQTPKNSKVQILIADTTTLKTVYTGSANSSKIVAVIVSSTDTSDRDIQIGITTSAVFYILGTVTVPALSGFSAGLPAVDLLAAIEGLPIDNDGQAYLYLTSASDTLQVKSLTTVTVAKEVDVTAIGADF